MSLSTLSLGSASLQFWLALLTFLYVDFLDTTGTLFSMANFLNNFVPGACKLWMARAVAGALAEDRLVGS